MLKKDKTYIGELYLTTDGIIIDNHNEKKFFSNRETDEIISFCIKTILSPSIKSQENIYEDSIKVIKNILKGEKNENNKI